MTKVKRKKVYRIVVRLRGVVTALVTASSAKEALEIWHDGGHDPRMEVFPHDIEREFVRSIRVDKQETAALHKASDSGVKK